MIDFIASLSDYLKAGSHFPHNRESTEGSLFVLYPNDNVGGPFPEMIKSLMGNGTIYALFIVHVIWKNGVIVDRYDRRAHFTFDGWARQTSSQPSSLS